MENFRPEGEGAYDEGTEILDPDYTTNSGHAVQGNRQEKLIL